MKRRIFFWMEELKITPEERKAVSVLMAVLLTLGAVNYFWNPSPLYGKEDYAAVDTAFHRRAEVLKAKETKLLSQRYYPSVSKASAVRSDTVPADSPKPEKHKPAAPNTSVTKINVNTAGAQKLRSLPGIGPAYAKRIMEYRSKNGPFQTIEELLKIKGIGKKRLEKLRPFVKLKDSTDNE